MTPKQQRFVQEYLIDLNATQACIRAGYSARSENRAAEIGYQLLQKTPVKSAIEAAQAKAAERHEITLAEITKDLQDAKDKAHEDGQHGAAVSAIMGLAKLHGFVVDKQKTEIVGKIEQTPMAEDDWESQYSGYARRVAPTNGTTKSTH